MAYILVGVFTETKMMPASLMAASTSVEKKRFFPLHAKTISSSPAITGRAMNGDCGIAHWHEAVRLTGLVDWQGVRVPSVDSRLVNVNDDHFDVRAFLGDFLQAMLARRAWGARDIDVWKCVPPSSAPPRIRRRCSICFLHRSSTLGHQPTRSTERMVRVPLYTIQ